VPDGASKGEVTTDKLRGARQGVAALIGSTLAGRYDIVRAIGAGGYGAVFLGRQRSMDRPVAIKVIHPHLVSSSTAVERFHREARLAARLSDPHIVTYFDFGESDGVLFLVMEYVRGRTLHQILREAGRLEPARAIELVSHIARGLASAHALGMVHRDLKPGNVLVTHSPSGTELVKLIDFGLVKLVMGDAVTPATEPLTASGVLVGTPSYMSPEQVRGQDVDARTDIYALGVMLYQALVGERPIQGGTAVETAALHITKEAPRLRESGLAVSPELEALVARCLAKRRDDRPDARGFLAELEALPERRGGPAPSTAPTSAATSGQVAAVGGESAGVGPETGAGGAPRGAVEATALPTSRVSRPLLAAVVVAAAIALLLVGLGLASRGGARRTEEIPPPRAPVQASLGVPPAASSLGEDPTAETSEPPGFASSAPPLRVADAISAGREAVGGAWRNARGPGLATALEEPAELEAEAGAAEERGTRFRRTRSDQAPEPAPDAALGTLVLYVIPWGNVNCSGGIREMESSHVRARVTPGDYSCTIVGPAGRSRSIDLVVRAGAETSERVSFEEDNE
jgi:predicted Ser/Thr protein kinase